MALCCPNFQWRFWVLLPDLPYQKIGQAQWAKVEISKNIFAVYLIRRQQTGAPPRDTENLSKARPQSLLPPPHYISQNWSYLWWRPWTGICIVHLKIIKVQIHNKLTIILLLKKYESCPSSCWSLLGGLLEGFFWIRFSVAKTPKEG